MWLYVDEGSVADWLTERLIVTQIRLSTRFIPSGVSGGRSWRGQLSVRTLVTGYKTVQEVSGAPGLLLRADGDAEWRREDRHKWAGVGVSEEPATSTKEAAASYETSLCSCRSWRSACVCACSNSSSVRAALLAHFPQECARWVKALQGRAVG
jgi:hypothetical protein